jgi:hypothetical protein
MGLESATYISGLVDTNPTGSDSISQGDDHLRLIKKVVQDSLPDVDQAAATVIVKATAPTTQVKGTIWYDTSANTLKMNTATTAATPVWAEVGVDAPWSSNLSKGCMFRANKSGSQSIAQNDWDKITMTTEVFDLGGDFASSTFTAPAAGKYYFNAAFRTDALHSSDDDIAIYKNSSAYAMHSTFRQVGSSYVVTSSTLMISCIMDMSASDTASMYGHTESSSGFSIGAGATVTFFEGYRLA